jgi:hypothetical protein
MLRRVRHKLRMIDYYSARRPQTVWTRALDVSLFASLPLAFLAAWICNSTVIRSQIAIDLPGHFMSREGVPLVAVLMMADSTRVPYSDGKPLGNFQLTVRDEHRGWPLSTTYRRHPARIDVDLLSEPRARKNAHLETGDPIRVAVESALRQDGQDEALEAWRQTGPMTRHHWLPWAAAVALWWIMLAFSTSVIISLAAYIARIGRSAVKTRRAQLAAEGRCAACGYDMTGLEFNERCPECGSIVW